VTRPQILTQRERNARAMKEDELLTNVIQMAKWKGWGAYHVRNSKAGVVQGDSGFPDLVLVRQRLMFVELKTELGDIRPEQHRWAEWLKIVGHTVRYWRPSDWLDGVIERALE
jgi:hypothetical protein